MERSPLFQWNGDRVEDVRFWCEPSLTAAALARIPSLRFPPFDGIATFESRGFFLAGIASSQLGLPVVMIRKHKKFFDKMPHESVSFTNWKNESETLSVLTASLPKVRRVLIVDDIFDTGRSLAAGRELLLAVGIEIVGAYYLLNAGTSEPEDFRIESELKQKLFE